VGVAISKLAAAHEQAGFILEQMIQPPDAGLSVGLPDRSYCLAVRASNTGIRLLVLSGVVRIVISPIANKGPELFWLRGYFVSMIIGMRL